MNEVLEKIKKHEILATILIILASIIIFRNILFSGILTSFFSAMIYYLSFKKLVNSIFIFFLTVCVRFILNAILLTAGCFGFSFLGSCGSL